MGRDGSSESTVVGAPKSAGRSPVEGGQTERVTVGIKWQASSAPGLLAFIERLAAYTEKGDSIARAAELIHLEEEGPTAASVREGKLNWSDVVDRFHHHKVSSGTISERTWRLRYRLHMNEVLQLLSEPKAPKNGNDLLRVLIERYAFRCPPGGDGRSHRFAHVRDLLVFSHQHCGAPESACHWPAMALSLPAAGR